jgi:hypothetical protein
MAKERNPKLGALAVRKGFASESEVQTALDLQKSLEPSADRPEARVGQILVEMGALTGDMLEVLLEEQAAARKAVELPSDTPAPALPPARIIVRSAVPLSVNGAPVTTTTDVKPGDILKVGNAILQMEASVAIVPSSEAPPEPPPPPPPRPDKVRGGTTVIGKVAELGTRFFRKKEKGTSGTELPSPAGPGLGEKLKNAAAKTGATVKKMIQDAAKRRWQKDRLGANRRRDELLCDVARAAIRMGQLEAPEVDVAKAALKALDHAEHSTGLRGSATTQEDVSRQRQSIKVARDTVELALVKLGYLVLKQGPEPPGLAEKIREIREIDAALATEG